MPTPRFQSLSRLAVPGRLGVPLALLVAAVAAVAAAAACSTGGGSGGGGSAAAPPGVAPGPGPAPGPAPLPPAAPGAAFVADDLGVDVASDPAVVADGEKVRVFYRAANGHLHLLLRDLGATAFAAPVDLGVAAASAPSAVLTGIDEVRVFYRGPNDRLHRLDHDPRAGWLAPVDLGGVALDSAPSAVRRGDGRVAVLYVGPGGRLHASFADPALAFAAPVDLGIAARGGVAAVAPHDEADRIEVFYAAPGGTLHHVAHDGTAFGAPADLGASAAGAPGAFASGRGRLDAFFADPSGELAHVARAGRTAGFGAAERHGLAPALAPAAVPAARHATEVYYRAATGRLHRARPAQPFAYPRLSEVYGTATHNSYWINRNHLFDPYASGTQELILDQLLHERVRALELDIHTDDGNPGVWTIYHTDMPSHSLARTLADAVEQLRLFHHLVPRHEAIFVCVELKNTNLDWSNFPFSAHNFDPTHTIADFDRTLREGLGDALYEPRDLLARAAPGSTLARAAEVAGWPTVDEMRGRFVFTLLGNWSNAAHDWAWYANEGAGVGARAAFPMRCIFDDRGDGIIGQWPGNLHDPLPAGWLDRAREASVFWQVEALSYAGVPGFLARNGIVRGADSYDLPDQQDRLGRGFHLLQTDYPWRMIDDAGPPGSGIAVDPSRRIRDPARVRGGPTLPPDALVEPGDRLYASTDDRPKHAYGRAPAGGGARRFETAVSTTRIGETYGTTFPRVAREGGIGGLRVAADRANLVEVLRIKTGASGDGYAQEVLTVRVGVARGGVYRSVDFRTSPFGTDVHGSLVALEVEPDAAAGGGAGCVVRAYSAGRTRPSGDPDWKLLAEERFPVLLDAQGICFNRDVLFAGTRLIENGVARAVTSCDVALQDGGPATVVDLGFPRPAPTCPPVLAPLP